MTRVKGQELYMILLVLCWLPHTITLCWWCYFRSEGCYCYSIHRPAPPATDTNQNTARQAFTLTTKIIVRIRGHEKLVIIVRVALYTHTIPTRQESGQPGRQQHHGDAPLCPGSVPRIQAQHWTFQLGVCLAIFQQYINPSWLVSGSLFWPRSCSSPSPPALFRLARCRGYWALPDRLPCAGCWLDRVFVLLAQELFMVDCPAL